MPESPGNFHCLVGDQPISPCAARTVRTMVAGRFGRHNSASADMRNLLSELVEDSTCAASDTDARSSAALMTGYFGTSLASAEGFGAAILRAPLAKWKDKCGENYVHAVLAASGYSEADRNALIAYMTPGSTGRSSIEGAGERARSIVTNSNCSNPSLDAQSLREAWRPLGAIMSQHKNFKQVALDPMTLLRSRCGANYALTVVSALNVVGPSYRALDEAARGP
jgi:hypothetical protein